MKTSLIVVFICCLVLGIICFYLLFLLNKARNRIDRLEMSNGRKTEQFTALNNEYRKLKSDYNYLCKTKEK
jgi:hypothetical protein